MFTLLWILLFVILFPIALFMGLLGLFLFAWVVSGALHVFGFLD